MLIRSISNSLITHLARLRTDNRYRREHNSIVIVGSTMVKEIAAHYPLKTLLVAEDTEIPEEITATKVIICSATPFKHATGLMQAHGYAAEIDVPAVAKLQPQQRLLVLDGVADPGNMGNLFRSALALGWEGIFLLPGCCDPYNDKALRAGRGTQLLLPHFQGSWKDLLAIVQSYDLKLLTAAAGGTPLPQLQLPQRIALIMGNEGQGVRPPPEAATIAIAIPMSPIVESLNVSTAGSILMYALRS
jgi:TrmH family RNA methyltransferase